MNPILYDLSDWTQITITGKDRQSFLHSFCTNDIKRLQPGQGCEAFIPNIKGRILGHVLVYAGEEELTLIAVPGSNNVLVPHLTKYLLGITAQVHDHTDSHAALCLVGPDSSQMIQQHLGIELPSDQHSHVERIGENGDILVARVNFTCLDSILVCASKEASLTLITEFLASGCENGTMDQFHLQRIAAGFPWHGIDITDETIAQEAARTAQAISFTKGCYLGQEPIARLDAMGHTNQELRQLRITSHVIPSPGDTVHIEDKQAGILKSVAKLNDTESLAIGMIKTKYADARTQLIIHSGNYKLQATVLSATLTSIEPLS